MFNSMERDQTGVHLSMPRGGLCDGRRQDFGTGTALDGRSRKQDRKWNAEGSLPVFPSTDFDEINALVDPTMPNANEPERNEQPQTLSARQRLYKWLDIRVGVDSILHEALDEPIPGGARWAYVFGSVLLFLFISQTI